MAVVMELQKLAQNESKRVVLDLNEQKLVMEQSVKNGQNILHAARAHRRTAPKVLINYEQAHIR